MSPGGTYPAITVPTAVALDGHALDNSSEDWEESNESGRKHCGLARWVWAVLHLGAVLCHPRSVNVAPVWPHGPMLESQVPQGTFL